MRRGTMAHEQVRAWTPPVAGIHEVFHAHFVDYAYPPHTHESWTVLIVDEGGIRFDLDRRHHDSVSSTVTVLPPHVVHDGRSASPTGFHKRVLYLDPSVIPLDAIGRAVDAPGIVDGPLRAAIADLHGRLHGTLDPLDVETRLASVGERLRTHLGVELPSAGGGAGVAGQLRELLDADVFGSPKLADAAAALETNVTHLARAFTARFGVSPHRYVIGRRIDEARRLLLTGMPAAQVAAHVGFHDQAHLTRHFARFVGTTPSRFAAPWSRLTA